MKLHLGCGKRYIVHVDVIDYPHVDHVSTIDNHSFLGDGTVNLTCHIPDDHKVFDGTARGWI